MPKWFFIPSSASWVPTDAQGTLVEWLDPTDNGTITQSGGAVSNIVTKDSNVWSYGQSNASFKPALGTLNGLQSLLFNGVFTSAPYLTQASPGYILNPTVPMVMGFAIKLASFNNGSFPLLFIFGTGSAQSLVLHIQSDNTLLFHSGAATGAWVQVKWAINSPPFKMTWIIYSDGTNTLAGITARLNGVSNTTLSDSGEPSNTMIGKIAASANNSTQSFQGDLGERVIITSPTAPDITNLTNYMESRWGT